MKTIYGGWGFLILSLLIGCKSSEFARVKTEIHIYAIPLTARTKFPISKKRIQKTYEYHVFVKDPDEILFIKNKISGLKKEKLIESGNIRVLIEIKPIFGPKKRVFLHQGGTPSIGKYYYEMDHDFVGFISDYLPKEYRLQ